MNRLNVNSIVYLLLSVAVIGSLFFLNTLTLNRLGVAAKVNFNIDDFMIKDFGIGDDGNPFLTVEGQAGGTVPEKKDTGYAYVFVTDKGTYAVSSDWMYTKWHMHELTLDENNCVESMNMNVGGANVSDAVIVTKTNATKLDKVTTAEFTINNVDGAICATKIFDSAP